MVLIMIVTINHLREAGHCVRGAKGWFEQHDLDFKDFLRHGIDADTFAATGDENAIAIVERLTADTTTE